MTIHKLNADHGKRDLQPLALGLSLHHDLYDLAETVLTTRTIRALETHAARYPIHRRMRCAAKRKLVPVFDDLALHTGLAAMRMDENSLLLDGAGVFVQAKGWSKAAYCSCEFNIWAESVARAEEIAHCISATIGEQIDRCGMFTIDWHFMNSRSGLVSASFDEVANEAIHDAAYPTLGMPVATFVDMFLQARETVLVLQGPPGTGKTRLVRAILAGLSKRKGEAANVMYTADKNALERDEIFVDFITGSHDAFVIEDADHLLLARSNGNHDLHRFLAIADGVVRAQGRKIVFTTNLPNISDIDEALLRPGRCFASIRTRLLDKSEAERVVVACDPARRDLVEALFANGNKAVTAARVYQMMDRPCSR
jgi:hypothetical protein